MNDTYVSTTSYASDSDYFSSVVTDNTPFPSMTKSQKVKLNELIQGSLNPSPMGFGERKSTPKVSTFAQNIGEVSDMSFKEDDAKNTDVKNSCCCLC